MRFFGGRHGSRFTNSRTGSLVFTSLVRGDGDSASGIWLAQKKPLLIYSPLCKFSDVKSRDTEMSHFIVQGDCPHVILATRHNPGPRALKTEAKTYLLVAFDSQIVILWGHITITRWHHLSVHPKIENLGDTNRRRHRFVSAGAHSFAARSQRMDQSQTTPTMQCGAVDLTLGLNLFVQY